MNLTRAGLVVAVVLWTTVFALVLRAFGAEVRTWWRSRGRPAPGLNTAADAAAFVEALHAAADARAEGFAAARATARGVARIASLVPRPRALGLVAEPVPPGVFGFAVDGRTGPPVEPVLRRTETPPPATAGTPIWDALVIERHRRAEALRVPTQEIRVAFDLIAERWLCTRCEAGDCPSCPGCSCPCKLPAQRVAVAR